MNEYFVKTQTIIIYDKHSLWTLPHLWEFIAFRCVYETSLVGWDCADSPPTIGASSPGPILHTHLDHTHLPSAQRVVLSV